MKRNFVDEDIYDKLMIAMKDSGITKEIFNLAKKMDLNLVRLFYEKLFDCKGDKFKKNKESLSKNLLGLYGNYFATFYFDGLKYETINEYPVYDTKGDLVTRADIAFYKDNELNLCEVKATSQLIDNVRNYFDINDKGYVGGYKDIDSDIIKYKNMGKKLIEQVEKLKDNSSAKINVVVFNGCRIDDIIKTRLKEEGVSIITLAIKITDLENFVNNVIEKVIDNYERRLGRIKG